MKITEFVFVSYFDSQGQWPDLKRTRLCYINLAIYGNRKSCMAYQYHAGWWFSRQQCYILLLLGTLTERGERDATTSKLSITTDSFHRHWPFACFSPDTIFQPVTITYWLIAFVLRSFLDINNLKRI